MTEHHLASPNLRESDARTPGGQAVRTPKVRRSDGLVPWRASQNEIVYVQVSHEVLLECDASSHRFLKHHEELARCPTR
jgi:hypothetical protein